MSRGKKASWSSAWIEQRRESKLVLSLDRATPEAVDSQLSDD